MDDLLRILEYIPQMTAAGVLAGILYLLMANKLHTNGHLETVRSMYTQEAAQHDKTVRALHDNNKALERTADNIGTIKGAVQELSEIRRMLQRIERKLDNRGRDVP